MIRLLITAALILSCSTLAEKNWIKTDNGVIINLKGETGKETRLMKVEVLSDQIIHISASPTEAFSMHKSLIAVESQRVIPEFVLASNRNYLVLSTSALKVKVSLNSGEVVFSDKDNNVLLKEKSPGGKTFTPITVEGTTGYTMRQVFESPDDEAFYGLGQHQSDEFNYKGKNEVLYQYNTKVSVPFVVSNKNYGVLWDNYSLIRFGDPRDYSELDMFNLYDSDGTTGGLSETYYNASDSTKAFLERKVSSIDYEDLESIKNFPKSVQLGQSKVIWNGKIEPKESGLFHFKFYYAGYVKLYIDGELVVPERWRTA